MHSVRLSFSRLLWFLLDLALVGPLGAALTAPATLSTTALKATSFTLKWTAATGATGGIAGYDVYQGGALIGSTSTARSFDVTGLAPTTTYSLTVVARDGAGQVSLPSTALAVTTPADTTAPSKPTALVASSLTTTSFTLGWTAPADNVGVTGYNLYRAGVFVGSSPTVTYNLTSLAPDTIHRMTVRARDAAGNLSAASAALSVRTLADPPSVPTGLNVANLKAASFTLKWTASTGGTGGIANYDVRRDGVLAGTTTKKPFVFTSQTPLTTSSLTVAARDHEGRVSAPSAALSVSTPADTTKPTVPKDLSATAVTHQAFTLLWTPATDNVGVTGYDVLRNNAVIGSSTTASFNVTGLAPLTAYAMKVKARDAAGNISAASTALTVTTAVAPNVLPTVALTAPVDGSFFTFPLTLTLTATAADPDGSIAKVEFFDGSVSLGLGAPVAGSPGLWSLTFSPSAIQSFSIVARATDNRNATTDSVPSNIRLLPGLPYFTDFEESEGYVSGSLHDQLGWTVATGAAQVTTDDSSSGEQSVRLEPGATVSIADQEIGAGAANPSPVFVDVFVQPVAGATPGTGSLADLDNARVAFVLSGPVGRFAALDGNGAGAGAWQNLPVDVALDSNQAASAWQRLTVRLDYTAKTWDFSLDGRLLAYDLKFRYNLATHFSGFSFQGHPTGASGFDDLYAAPDNPLFADADRDGMDDAWESVHGLNPALNDRNGDIDNDGISNIQEYLHSVDPNATDSDADGLSDEWELQFFGNLNHGPSEDFDNDGLTNLQEFQRGTSPDNPDSDGDGMLDGRELLFGRSPLKGVVPDTTGVINLRVYSPGQ